MDIRVSFQNRSDVPELFCGRRLERCRVGLKLEPVETEPGFLVNCPGRIVDEGEEFALHAIRGDSDDSAVRQLSFYERAQVYADRRNGGCDWDHSRGWLHTHIHSGFFSPG